MNRAELIGRLTKDPVIRYTSGKDPLAVGRFTLAVDRRGKDAGADFIPVVTFGSTAEFIEKYFVKGMRVGVSGRIQTGSYEDNDGNTVYTTEVIADDVEFADGKREEQEQPAPKSRRR